MVLPWEVFLFFFFLVLNYCFCVIAALGIRDGNEVCWLFAFSSVDLCHLWISFIQNSFKQSG